MEEKGRRYRAKSHIMGGGIALRQGQVVEEAELHGFHKSLERAGAIELVPSSQVRTDRPVAGKA